jgi:hypothetical protein
MKTRNKAPKLTIEQKAQVLGDPAPTKTIKLPLCRRNLHLWLPLFLMTDLPIKPGRTNLELSLRLV